MDAQDDDSRAGDGVLRTLQVKGGDAQLGFQLTRSRWDPYPWVKSVEEASAAEESGLRRGDCLLRVDDDDLAGRSVADAAELLRREGPSARLTVWSCEGGAGPSRLRRLTDAVAGVVNALECPVCCATVRPPAQSCPRGHLVCKDCRASLHACPLCRAPLTNARNLFADQVHECVVDALDLPRRPRKQPSPPEPGHRHRARLLQRLLLPARARSTGNIPAEEARERDMPRSLSTLDVAACDSERASPSGSCSSLSAKTALEIGLRCPADPSCRERVRGDVRRHALEAHGGRMILSRGDAVELEVDDDESKALLHPCGEWFYPKCVREAGGGGVRVWCWCEGGADVAADYRCEVSVVRDESAPLLAVASPVLSLRAASWGDVRAPFLGDALVGNGARLRLSVAKV